MKTTPLASVAHRSGTRAFIATGFAAAVLLLPPSAVGATEPSAGADATEAEPASESGPSKTRMHFGVFAAGYQGSRTRQIYAPPGRATLRNRRDGGELLSSNVNGFVSSMKHGTKFHTEYFRVGGVLARTQRPTTAAALEDGREPRHGVNFGLFSDSRGAAGAAFGGVCGFAVSGVAGESIKAFTRSTVPGNKLKVNAGVASGLQCAPRRTLIVAQYAIEGNLGVEQLQDLTAQQGTAGYDANRGNGLLLYAGHGPMLMLVHASEFLRAALSAEYSRSIGAGRWGGRRSGVRAMLTLALGRETGFGIAPWYRFDAINYGAASKVSDNNRRFSQTFGVAFAVVRSIAAR